MSYETPTEPVAIDTEAKAIETKTIETRAGEKLRSSSGSLAWAVLWIVTAFYATSGVLAPILILSLAFIHLRTEGDT